MLYLSSQPGQAIAIPLPNDVATPLGISGWDGAISMNSIVTELAIARRVGYQSQSTLDNRTFITIFGDRPGRIRVAGLSFASGCSGNDTSGTELVGDFYDTYNAASYGSPLVIAYGSTPSGVFSAFLVGLDLGLNNPEMRMAQFGLEFLVVPKQSGSSSSSSGSTS